MTTEVERQYANNIGPIASAIPGFGTAAITTSTTAAVVDLQLLPGNKYSLHNRYIELQADGGDIYIAFSSDGVPVIDETAGNTTLATGTLATVPWKLVSNTSMRIRCEKDTYRYLHVKAASGTPKLRIRPASQIRDADK